MPASDASWLSAAIAPGARPGCLGTIWARRFGASASPSAWNRDRDGDIIDSRAAIPSFDDRFYIT